MKSPEFSRTITYQYEDVLTLVKGSHTQALTGTGKAPFLRDQFGGDAGGPIIKNRTHFHVAFERTETDDSYAIFTGSAHQFYSGFEGVFNRPSLDQLFNIRGDQQISPSQHLFGRYSQEWNFLSRNGCGGITLQICYDGVPGGTKVAGLRSSLNDPNSRS